MSELRTEMEAIAREAADEVLVGVTSIDDLDFEMVRRAALLAVEKSCDSRRPSLEVMANGLVTETVIPESTVIPEGFD